MPLIPPGGHHQAHTPDTAEYGSIIVWPHGVGDDFKPFGSRGSGGIQIHQQLVNAIKLLADFLAGFCAGDASLRLSSFDAGIAHNVIPREGRATFSTPPGCEQSLRARIDACSATWRGYLPAADEGLRLELSPAATPPAELLDADATRSILDVIALFPHGAQAYSLEQPADLVDLSINLAIARLDAASLFVESSFRFFNEEQSQPLQRSVEALARTCGLTVTPVAGYPGWQPDFASPLLARGIALHERLFGEPPAVKAIHAGLECGILKSKKPDIDILSFGPTIRGAHSPTERLRIDTVGPFWEFLTALLAEL